ncbi:hypothetical protein RJ639_005382, partial [Escallonia herrerae]
IDDFFFFLSFYRHILSEREKDMGRLFLISLEGSTYSCKHCQTQLALLDDMVSKSFHSKHGKAYLFEKVVNVTVGEEEERMMITGMHTVADIFCESAHEKCQKYKEGKFILERFKVLGPDGSAYWVGQDPQVGSDADDT